MDKRIFGKNMKITAGEQIDGDCKDEKMDQCKDKPGFYVMLLSIRFPKTIQP